MAHSADVRFLNDCPSYDNKQSDGEIPLRFLNECPSFDNKQSYGEILVMLELWEMQCTYAKLNFLNKIVHMYTNGFGIK